MHSLRLIVGTKFFTSDSGRMTRCIAKFCVFVVWDHRQLAILPQACLELINNHDLGYNCLETGQAFLISHLSTLRQ